MNAVDIYEKARYDLEHNKITCGEYDKIVDPLRDVQPVKHGHWDIEISDSMHEATYRCSECGHQFRWIYDRILPPVFNYCKNCGADMREKS